MDARPSAIDRCFQSESTLCGTMKIPRQFVWISSDLLQIPEFVFFSLMPEHRFAKDQPEGHFVYQCLQCARTSHRSGKIRMRPSPEVAMPVSAVVSLHSEAQRIAFEAPAIERDLAGKKRVGMRRSRESNPALVAQRDAKCGTIADSHEIAWPSTSNAPWQEFSPISLLPILEVEWILPSGAEMQAFQGKSLNEALRLSIPRKPRGPHLNGHSARVACATAPARIHQQISEPPRPAAVRQSQTNKPDFVTAPGERDEYSSFSVFTTAILPT